MARNAPIGILDSGVGGLTVWQKIEELLPKEQTLYLADSAHAPYGSRTDEEIFRFASKLIEFLLKHNVKIIIVACNTITVSCINRLRKNYPQIEIVGTVPAIKTAVRVTKNKKIGILTTEGTAKSYYQRSLVKEFSSNCNVTTIGTNKLVPLIEKGDREGIRDILPSILRPFSKHDIDVLVLGCTHYPLIADLIENEIGKRVVLIDTGEPIARRVKELLQQKSLLAQRKTVANRFFTTGSVEDSNEILHQILKQTKKDREEERPLAAYNEKNTKDIV
jgi:glutamate racemase